MNLINFLLLFICRVFAYDFLTFSQPSDHFGYTQSPASFFSQRYYINKQWCRERKESKNEDQNISSSFVSSSSCPILFFVGGESEIDMYINESYSGFVWQLSQKLGATLVFAEHRYYGSSVPSSSVPFQYLSSQQAVADFALLASFLSSSSSIPVLSSSSRSSPPRVIAIGGSYSGMLAIWLRQKFPSTFYGAFGASAPLLSFQLQDIDINQFYDIVSNGYEQRCREGIRKAFEELLQTAQTGQFDLIQRSFQLCDRPQSTGEAINLISLLQQVFTNYAQGNYPFPHGGLPANPTQAACSRFLEAKGGMAGLSSAASFLLNTSSSCVAANLSEWQAFTPGFTPGVWTFQRCTEIVIPAQVADHVNQSFLPCPLLPGNCWNITSLRAFCKRQFGVTVPASIAWSTVDHGITSTSSPDRLLFSNGVLDPWSFAGIQPANNSIWMVGAHHADLSMPNSADHPTIVTARSIELNTLTEWLST